jgi:hypothetical protein
MERILYDQLYNYLTKFELLSDCQFGFRKFHSTATALLDCTNDWYMNLDRKMFNLVVLIDCRPSNIIEKIRALRNKRTSSVFSRIISLKWKPKMPNTRICFIREIDQKWRTTRLYFRAPIFSVIY